MSNQAVGAVYGKIIQDVIEASQVDFEEGGVDQSTLDALRQVWQGKLSSIRVAQFPWDPTPPPDQAGPTSGSVMTQPPSSNGTPAQTPPASGSMQAPKKAESSQSMAHIPAYTAPQLPPNSMANMTAQQRAAAALQQKFGPKAAPQISQLQGQAFPPQQAAPTQSYGDDAKPSLSTLQQMQQAQQSSVGASQTDGPGNSLAEWKAEVARRRADAAQNPGVGDRLIREQFLDMQQRIEGGGLLMPLEERYYPKSGVKRKVRNLEMAEGAASSSATNASTVVGGKSEESLAPHNQFDGPDDDDEDDDEEKLENDEDAINSDLDDPEEITGDPDADAETDQAMLCTYDKVQRVKNKWKCTLKDGVLKVDGKEYVFHKGQGEFEW